MKIRVFIAAGTLLLAALGCRDDAKSPTEPASTAPQADVSAAAKRAQTGFRLAQIEAGYGHTCGIARGGEAYCWGDDFFGQLGNGLPLADADVPASVSGGLTFIQVSPGFYHTCGLTQVGKAYCWGLNFKGEVGNGSSANHITEPTPVAGGLTFTQVSAGQFFTCALTTGGEAYCWGGDDFGQLGNGAPLAIANTPSPVAGGLTFTQISAGPSHTCAVTRVGDAYCWGLDAQGQLGNGAPLADTSVPSRVAGGLTFAQVSAGRSHTCGITTGGQAYCWGSDFQGQLGNGAPAALMYAPAAVVGELTFRQVSVGSDHSCGLTRRGNAYCWGFDDRGQLGNGGPLSNTDTPSLVAGRLRFAQLDAGLYHTCGLTKGRRRAYCWGSDVEGQLGNGTRGATDTPTPVSAPGL
jgi:alpha-tubulin suppressor-like RCC1 family protein